MDDYSIEDRYNRDFNTRMAELARSRHNIPAEQLTYAQQHALAGLIYAELGARIPAATTYNWKK